MCDLKITHAFFIPKLNSDDKTVYLLQFKQVS